MALTKEWAQINIQIGNRETDSHKHGQFIFDQGENNSTEKAVISTN